MKVINLLPHPIALGTEDKNCPGQYNIVHYPGYPETVDFSLKPQESGAIVSVDGLVLPTQDALFIPPENFPEPQDGVVYLTTFIVAVWALENGREDVFAPGHMAVNQNTGQPICVMGLRRPMMAVPDAGFEPSPFYSPDMFVGDDDHSGI